MKCSQKRSHYPVSVQVSDIDEERCHRSPFLGEERVSDFNLYPSLYRVFVFFRLFLNRFEGLSIQGVMATLLATPFYSVNGEKNMRRGNSNEDREVTFYLKTDSEKNHCWPLPFPAAFPV